MAIVLLAYTVIWPSIRFQERCYYFHTGFVVLLAVVKLCVYLILGGATVLFTLAITFVNLTGGNFCLNISTIDF